MIPQTKTIESGPCPLFQSDLERGLLLEELAQHRRFCLDEFGIGFAGVGQVAPPRVQLPPLLLERLQLQPRQPQEVSRRRRVLPGLRGLGMRLDDGLRNPVGW